MMRIKDQRFSGSFTLEAAGVMAVVFFSLGAALGQAGRMHDRAAGAMVLHEAVEKARHEKGEDPQKVGEEAQGRMGLLLSFPGYGISLGESGGRYQGRGEGGEWSRVIEAAPFRPEKFLRMITLLDGLEGQYED